jgi:hypothetical protein
MDTAVMSIVRRHLRSHRREALNCFAFDQKPRERCVWMTTKSAFPVLGAPNRRGCAGASYREFGIAKILEKLQLHPHQGRHPVDVDSEACVNFNDARH